MRESGFPAPDGKQAGMPGKKGGRGKGDGGENRFGRILSGLTDIAEKLSEISERGKTVTKKGRIHVPVKEGGVKGVYGFSLKTGLGGKDDAIKVEPFGNIRKDKKPARRWSRRSISLMSLKTRTPPPDRGNARRETGDIKIDVRDDVLTVLPGEKSTGKRSSSVIPRQRQDQGDLQQRYRDHPLSQKAR